MYVPQGGGDAYVRRIIFSPILVSYYDVAGEKMNVEHSSDNIITFLKHSMIVHLQAVRHHNFHIHSLEAKFDFRNVSVWNVFPDSNSVYGVIFTVLFDAFHIAFAN